MNLAQALELSTFITFIESDITYRIQWVDVEENTVGLLHEDSGNEYQYNINDDFDKEFMLYTLEEFDWKNA